MLNLNADWFREHLLNFQGENYVIVSSDSYVVASQCEELNAMSLSLLGRISEQKRGYLIDRLNGKRTICFFSPLDVNDWYCRATSPMRTACPVWPKSAPMRGLRSRSSRARCFRRSASRSSACMIPIGA